MSDADDPTEPDTSLFSFPAYLAMRDAPGGGEEVVVDRAEGQAPCLPVFTDQDLAERFVATLPPGAMLTVVWGPDELAELVQQAAAAGVAHVVPDPGKRALRIPADVFLRAIAGLPPGQPG
jgi:hypothetical protein